MSFVEIDPGGTGNCTVPSGGAPGYGYAGGNMRIGTRCIRSVRYAPCNGIITFDVSTGDYTLSHFPPGGPKGADRAAYIAFLARHAKPATTIAWVVGGFPARRDPAAPVDGAPATLLTTAGLPVPAVFTGPLGRACDVLVGAGPGFAGVAIYTRPAGGVPPIQITWASLIPS